MEGDLANYEAKYSELELLGRGNYGSAYVVKSNVSSKLFVAKKMQLDGLTEKEIQSTQGEINILKKFSDVNQYPFIVKYHESFSFEKNLIILMEFCEYGDLAGFIRNAKRKGDLLNEKVIIAWFIMLMMGIQALHSKNVLHRDLKSANVFLTSNKFIKIGDFGISKILDSTSAKTFVGTPYYLSPQICSNRPYEFSSDIWSLGCILYELCTLNYPFQANNILNLALKITSEEVVPIPKSYSKELNDIVMGLLQKDPKKRMSIEAILQTPYITKFMQENGENIDKICEKIPLKKAAKSDLSDEEPMKKSLKESNEAEDTMKTIKSNFEKTNNSEVFNLSRTEDSLDLSMTELSPAQRAKERKRREADKQAEKMKSFIKESTEERQFASNKKKQEFGGGKTTNLAAKKLAVQYQNENKKKFQETKKQKRGLGNVQTINLEYISTMTQKMRDMGVTTNHDERIVPALEKTIEKNPSLRVYTEGVEQSEEEYYEDDFEDYVAEEIQEEDKDEIQAVTTFISVVSGNVNDISPSKRAKVEKTFEKTEILPSSHHEKLEQARKKCISLVNKERFELLYEMVSKCYEGGMFKQTPQLKVLRKQGSPVEKQVLQLIDEIKYYENEMA